MEFPKTRFVLHGRTFLFLPSPSSRSPYLLFCFLLSLYLLSFLTKTLRVVKIYFFDNVNNVV